MCVRARARNCTEHETDLICTDVVFAHTHTYTHTHTHAIDIHTNTWQLVLGLLEIMAYDLSLSMAPLTVTTAERCQTLGLVIAAAHLAQAATLQLVQTLVSSKFV